MALIDNVKSALRVSTSFYDTEIKGYIDSAIGDMAVAGVVVPVYDATTEYIVGTACFYNGVPYICITETIGAFDSACWAQDWLYTTAVITYVRSRFGSPADYDKLKAAYDEQKAQLSMNSRYTNFADYGL